VLDHNSLEQFRSHPTVPHTVGVNDNDRAFATHSEARSFSAFHATGTKKKALTIEKIREQ
jgi:hypothetical protein